MVVLKAPAGRYGLFDNHVEYAEFQDYGLITPASREKAFDIG